MGKRSPATAKTIKRGEVYMKPGDKVANVAIIQSGVISICQRKNDAMAELFRAMAPEIIADEAVLGAIPWQHTAIALKDAKIVEIPIALLRTQINALDPVSKVFFKALSERAKACSNELRTLRSNLDTVPCPGDSTAKVFGVILHVGRAIGEKQGDSITAPWTQFKHFAYEVFQEPNLRLEEAVNILIRLNYAKLDFSPEAGPEGKISLTEMIQIENFCDYYRSYYFKGEGASALRTNAKMTKLTEDLLKVASEYPVDRMGNVHLPYKATVDAMKKLNGKTFEADQLFRLEQKGLFIKRTATKDGGILSFYKPDFEQMLLNWKILREVEQWNERGYVDMSGFDKPQNSQLDEDSERARWRKIFAGWKVSTESGSAPKIRTGGPVAGELWCSICLSVIKKGDPVCMVCGCELNADGSPR